MEGRKKREVPGCFAASAVNGSMDLGVKAQARRPQNGIRPMWRES